MKAKKELIDIKKEQALQNRTFKSLATKVKNSCEKIGVRAVEFQLEFLMTNKTILPNNSLSKDKNIKAFKVGIKAFKNGSSVSELIKESQN